MTTQNDTAQQRLIKASHWNKYHEWPPIGGLRHLIFNKKKNGFDKVIIQIGKTVLIDEPEFFRWADEHRLSKATAAK